MLRRCIVVALLSVLTFTSGPALGAPEPRTTAGLGSSGRLQGAPPPAPAALAEASWSAARLSEPRSRIAAATIGSTAIFAGGLTTTRPSDAVDIYDTATGQWEAARLSRGRTRPQVATVGDKLLAIGGDGSTEAFSIVDVYDPASGQWTTLSLPGIRSSDSIVAMGDVALFPDESGTVDVYDARAGRLSRASLAQPRRGPAAAVVGQRALLAGGSVGNRTSDAVDMYGRETNAWTAARLSEPRTEIASAVIGNRALFAGGISSAVEEPRAEIGAGFISNRLPFAGGIGSSAVDVFDAASGHWSTAALSEPGPKLVAVVGDRALFVSRGSITGVVDVYDATADAWSAGVLPTVRGRMGGAVAGTIAVFAGGASRAVDIYDAATGEWTSTRLPGEGVFAPGGVTVGDAVLRTDRDIGGRIVVVGGTVIFAGGYTVARAGGNQQYAALVPSAVAEVYDTLTGEWSDAALSVPSYRPGVGVAGTQALFAGESELVRPRSATPLTIGNPVVSASVNVYDSTNGDWTHSKLSVPRRDVAVATTGSRVLFVGGYNRQPRQEGSGAVDLFDAATGEWTSTRLPRLSGDLAVRTLGARAFFFTEPRSPTRVGPAYLDIYNVPMREWTTVTLTEDEATVQAAVAGTKLVAVWSGRGRPAEVAAIFDSLSGAWAAIPLSEPRNFPGPVASVPTVLSADNIVVLMGTSAAVDIFDASTDTWKVTRLPEERAWAAAAVAGGKLLVAGGERERTGSDALDIYDVASDAWTSLQMSEPRARPRIVPLQDGVLIGSGGVRDPARTIDRYQVGSGELANVAPSALDIYAAETGAFVRTIPFAGMLIQAGATAERMALLTNVQFAAGRGGDLLVFDTEAGEWRGAVPPGRFPPPPLAAGDKVVVIGGPSATPSGNVYLLDARTGAWTVTGFPATRDAWATVSVGNLVLVAGGGASDRVDILRP